MAKVKGLFGYTLKVTITDNEIIIKGDLHNHRKRKPLIKYLMGN